MKNYCRLLLVLIALLSPCLKVNAQVTANFTINYQYPNCTPSVVTFVNTSTGTDASTTYLWDFGVPGLTSTFINPSTTYAKCGTYTVKLTVTSGTGQKSTKTQIVTTNCNPQANLTVSGGQSCAPSLASFTSTSTGGTGTITSYVWDFGDGYMGSGANPTHNYTTPGCKSVTLVVTNSSGCVSDTTFKNIVCPASSPVADFTSSNQVSCYAPLDVNYSPNITGGTAPYTYTWSFLGGVPAAPTSANPSVDYASPGFYNAQMIVADKNGCKDTIRKTAYVQIGNNFATFDVSSPKGCAPLYEYFYASTPSVLDAAIWHAPGATDTVQNNREFVTSYQNPGTYQVCLSATFPGGCIASKCTTIVVGSVPKAAFTVSGNNTTCVPPINNVKFTNTSTGTGTLTYYWSFPGGTPSSSTLKDPPPVSYNTCGNYNVYLAVTNQAGCTDTMKMDSIVNINCPVASATVSGKSGCVPYDVTFNSTGSTGSPVKWFWNFGDSGNPNSVQSTQQNPSHTYTTPNTLFDVRLIIENALGCRDTVFYKSLIVAGTKPKASFTAAPTTVCAGLPVNFTNTSTGTSGITAYKWDFVGGPPYIAMSTKASPSYIYPDTGTFGVSLIVSNNGCADTVNVKRLVKINPPIAVITETGNCVNLFDITLHGETSIGADTYSWSIPGGSPSISNSPTVSVHYAATGNYTATLTVTNKKTGCSYSTSKTIYIKKVKADFSMPSTSGCAPFSACFQNLSVDGNTYRWNIINSAGQTINSKTFVNPPCQLLGLPGVYSISLTATDINGCSNNLTKTNLITVYGLNAALSGGGVSCAPYTVNFKDLSSSPTSTAVSWSWDFGDPLSGASNHSTSQNPTHVYNNDGNFAVILSVTDNHGCVNIAGTNSNGVTVSKPYVNFFASDSTVCLGNPICFTNLTSSIIGDFTYSWDLGDGSPIVVTPNPCYTYKDTGWYTVKLTARNYYGCTGTIIKNKYIHVITPIADFKGDSLVTSCPPLQVHFTNKSLGSDTSTHWLWSFGDGATSTAKNPFHIYTYAGKFDVSLRMTESNGCTSVLDFPQYVNITGPIATVVVTPKAGCVPLHTCFSAKSPNTIAFIWNFGDGSVLQSGPDSICYSYSRNGIYHPQLILNDGLGCVYALPVDSVTVADPQVGFKLTPPEMCGGGVVTFTDTSSSTVKINYWNWNFGDPGSGANNTSLFQNPTHNYSSVKSYTVQLTIKDILGCTGSYMDTLIVHPYPKAAFTYSDSVICPEGTIQFTSTSTSTDLLTGYKWSFGDAASGSSNTSTLQNAAHSFSTPGTYTIKLVITSKYGCSDSITHTIKVRNFPVPNAGPDKSICINNSTTITATGGANYFWGPSTGLSATNGASVNAAPVVTTTYTLTVNDGFGCSATDNVVVTVNSLPIISAGPDKSVCFGLSTTLTANGGVSYTWSPATGLNNTAIQSPVATPAVNTTYIVTGKDGNGCLNKDTMMVTLKALPTAYAGLDASICLNGSTQLTGTGGVSYSWSPSATLTQPNTAFPVASPKATTNYIVAVTDSNGCVGKDTVKVTVIPLPPVNAGADQDICIGFSANLKATGANSYEWFPVETLSDSLIANPVATPTITTTYSVIGTGPNGCRATDSMVVNVHYNPSVSAGSPKIICYGTSTQLFATGAATYLWTPINGLNNSGIPNPVASPKNTITYYVTGASTYGCKSTDSVTVTVLPAPPANAGTDAAVCAGDSTRLNASGGVSYSWTPAGTLSNPAINNPIARPVATTNYIVVVTDTNHCTATDTVQVVVNPLPTINAGPDRTLCEGTALIFHATGGITYRWYPPSALSDSAIADPIANPTNNIQYAVTGYDNIGCKAKDTVNVTVIHPFKANVSPGVDVCAGEAVQLNVSGGASYHWAPPFGLDNNVIPNPFASPDLSTNYQVIVSDGMCFADTEFVYVKVNPLPVVFAGQDVMILAGASTPLNATSADSNVTYSWYPPAGLSCIDCANPVAKPAQTTSYVVVCTNVNGCNSMDTVIVTVGCDDDVMFIPNAFTPNGDGQNDKFYIRSYGLRSLDYMRIYDRWGELVYSSTDLGEGWDGNFHGKPVLPGVYVYYTEAICSNGQKILRQGNITVIR